MKYNWYNSRCLLNKLVAQFKLLLDLSNNLNSSVLIFFPISIGHYCFFSFRPHCCWFSLYQLRKPFTNIHHSWVWSILLLADCKRRTRPFWVMRLLRKSFIQSKPGNEKNRKSVFSNQRKREDNITLQFRYIGYSMMSSYHCFFFSFCR